MDFWQKARVFAEEAANISQEISKEAAKRSQELTQGAAKFSQEFVSETAKKSKELAAEASKKADQIKIEAIKRADQLKSLAGEIEIPIQIPPISSFTSQVSPLEEAPAAELERFGVTDELREFVNGITISTFRDFPMEDEPEISEVPTMSNVRQDLNEWQAKHATLVLSTVKEISKFRYVLCPRYMKERKFWRIYFILVNNYVALYEKQYMDNLKVEKVEQKKSDGTNESSSAAPSSAAETKEATLKTKTSTSSITEHDLDVFLLGDLGSDDDGPDDGGDGFDDDFDKIEGNSSAYLNLLGNQSLLGGQDYAWLWKHPIPSQWRHFIWLVKERIVTNSLRWRWGISDTDTCVVCGVEVETVVHVLRDCSAARMGLESDEDGDRKSKQSK